VLAQCNAQIFYTAVAMSSATPNPNVLMRFRARYFAWARDYYARKNLPPALMAQAIALDELLYSRRGLGVWLGFFGSMAGGAFGLKAAGLGWGWAIGLSVFIVSAISFALLSTWLRPEQFTARSMRRVGVIVILAAFSGTIVGVLMRSATSAQTPLTWERLADVLWRTAPLQLLVGLALLLLMYVTAAARRHLLSREMAQLRAEQERDAAARQAAEAQLKLLRAQIQPHFIFNTLSALQHWVDTADPRAPALLRSLTGFLRSSTELLARDETKLGDEVAMVRHYLAVMTQRLGDRLQHEVTLDPALAAVVMPPGVLLTLVENAIEHGISPVLAGGHLDVRITAIDARCTIHVSDDGAGIDAGAQDGLGLTNVRERLHHRYGSAATLTLAPRAPRGCVATVSIPLQGSSPKFSGADPSSCPRS
jgi:sensor histidine kinase YesM